MDIKDIVQLKARKGVIIECPLNGQYHDRRDVILTSRMAVSNNFITVTVIQNIVWLNVHEWPLHLVAEEMGMEMGFTISHTSVE